MRQLATEVETLSKRSVYSPFPYWTFCYRPAYFVW